MIPDPEEDDDWLYGEFEAIVEGFRSGYLIVEDADEDSFMISPERVYNIEDEWYMDKYKPEGISYEKAKEIESYNL